jgi:hypothetical protein
MVSYHAGVLAIFKFNFDKAASFAGFFDVEIFFRFYV